MTRDEALIFAEKIRNLRRAIWDLDDMIRNSGLLTWKDYALAGERVHAMMMYRRETGVDVTAAKMVVDAFLDSKLNKMPTVMH